MKLNESCWFSLPADEGQSEAQFDQMIVDPADVQPVSDAVMEVTQESWCSALSDDHCKWWVYPKKFVLNAINIFRSLIFSHSQAPHHYTYIHSLKCFHAALYCVAGSMTPDKGAITFDAPPHSPLTHHDPVMTPIVTVTLGHHSKRSTVQLISRRWSCSRPLSRKLQKHCKVDKIQIHHRRKYKQKIVCWKWIKTGLQINTELIMQVMKRRQSRVIARNKRQKMFFWKWCWNDVEINCCY